MATIEAHRRSHHRPIERMAILELKAARGPVSSNKQGLPLRVFNAITAMLNSAASAWVCVLMLIICADIAARGLFNHPLPGVAEIVALSIVALVFLQLAHTVKSDRMPMVRLFLMMLDKRYPRVANLMRLLSQLMGVAVFAIILEGSYPTLIKSIQIHEYVGVQGTFTAPTWPAKLSVVVGSGLVCLQYLIFAATKALSLIRDSSVK